MKFKQKGLPQTGQGPQVVPQYSKTDKYFEAGALRSPNYVKGKQGVKIDLETGTGEFRRINIGTEIINLSAGQGLKDAIEELNNGDGGTINLGIGTFTLGAYALTPTKPIQIIGISPSQTIIDFNNTAGKFSFQGSGVYSTGTITSISGGVSVTGSGTSWLTNVTALSSQLFINGAWHLIAAVTGDTTLVLAEGYTGPTVTAGTAYVIATPILDIRLANFSVKNSSGSALDFDYVRYILLENLLLQDNNIGIDANYFSEFSRTAITAVSNTSDGFKYVNGGRSAGVYENAISNGGHGHNIEAVRTFSLSGCSNTGNTADGFHLKTATDVQLSPIEARSNGGQGIECESGCNGIIINAPIADGNTSDGIKFTATTDDSQVIGGNISNNGGYGINIAASTCDNNLILAPHFDTNTSGEVSDSGTGTTRIQQGDALSPFGSGADGDVTISADTTLSTDKYYANLTINSTKSLTTAGYLVYVSGTLTNNGTIKNNGGAGGNGGVGGTAGGGGGTAGTAGAAAAGATLDAGTAGQAGGAGSTGNTSNSAAGTSVNPSLGSSGVQGGTGGTGATGTPGTVGAAGTATSESLSATFGISPSTFAAGTITNSSGLISFIGSSSGASLSSSAGSSGGVGGVGDNGTQTGGGGGGSGGSGGNMVIVAKTIVNTGTIQVNGGNGGNGGNGSSTGGATGGGGGGGGGSGGVLAMFYKTLNDTGTIQAAGGTKGTGGSAGSGGGGAGGNGTDGLAGKIYKAKLV